MPERWLPNPSPYPPRPPLDWPERDAPLPTPADDTPAGEPEPTTRGPLALVVVGVALLAALATFALLLLIRPPKKRVVASAPTTTASPPTVPSTTAPPDTTLPGAPPNLTRAQLDEALPSFESFVERHRGLKYKTRPTVVLDPPTAYLAAWHAYLAEDAPLLRHLDVVLTSFGLNPSNADLVKAQQTWLGDQTVAFYDPVAHRVHVRAVPFTPFVAQQLVGMLTRAIDDQWFSIGRLDPAKGLGDEEFALRSLVTGDEQRVANTWLSTRAYTEQQDAMNERADRTPTVSDPNAVPVALARWLSTPDTAGPDLVQAIVQDGGFPALDKAFTTPPSGSQQTMAPTRFLAGEVAAVVSSPAPGGTVEARGRLGQLLVQEAFTDKVDSDLLSEAMDGYAGDATVSWRKQGQSCTRINLASADAAAAQAMAQAVDQWAKKVDASFVVVTDPARPGVPLVMATVCHPGGGGSSTPSTTTPTPGGPPGSGPGDGPNI